MENVYKIGNIDDYSDQQRAGESSTETEYPASPMEQRHVSIHDQSEACSAVSDELDIVEATNNRMLIDATNQIMDEHRNKPVQVLGAAPS